MTKGSIARTSNEIPLKQFADGVLKYLPLLGVVFYGLGIVITNLYLVQFGVTDFSVLKPQCVVTGAWASVFLVLAGAPAVSCCHVMALHWKDSLAVQIWSAIRGYITWICIATLAAYLLALPLGLFLRGAGPAIISWILLVAIMSLPLVGAIAGRQPITLRQAYGVLAAGSVWWRSLPFW